MIELDMPAVVQLGEEHAGHLLVKTCWTKPTMTTLSISRDNNTSQSQNILTPAQKDLLGLASLQNPPYMFGKQPDPMSVIRGE